MTRSTRRRQVVRGLVGLAVGFGGALGTILAMELFDEAPATPLQLGTPDFAAYCARDTQMTAMLLASDANGWRCAGAVAGVPRVLDVDTNDVCRWQFSDDRVIAVLVDPSDTVGWACVRNG
ncbi:MAG TPA: hypothetical protein VNQ73_05600 [Ilumatobacter sp.]|nr:hypothetical protein [Ilumatobacter sp.]